MTGPEVFPLALGCMGMSGMYGPTDDAESLATIHAALDAGVGATVQSINAVSDSSATAVITFASDAPLGMRSLKISRDDGTSSTCSCFQVVPAPGRITGHVTGTNGVVFGFANAYIDGSAVPSVYAAVQPDGSYSFDNLTPGDYRIAFGGYTTNFVSYSPQWWNGAATQASATTASSARAERDPNQRCAAIMAGGDDVFSRGLKYRRPRGVLSANFHDPNCLVQVDGEIHMLTAQERGDRERGERFVRRPGRHHCGQQRRLRLGRQRDHHDRSRRSAWRARSRRDP